MQWLVLRLYSSRVWGVILCSDHTLNQLLTKIAKLLNKYSINVRNNSKISIVSIEQYGCFGREALF